LATLPHSSIIVNLNNPLENHGTKWMKKRWEHLDIPEIDHFLFSRLTFQSSATKPATRCDLQQMQSCPCYPSAWVCIPSGHQNPMTSSKPLGDVTRGHAAPICTGASWASALLLILLVSKWTGLLFRGPFVDGVAKPPNRIWKVVRH